MLYMHMHMYMLLLLFFQIFKPRSHLGSYYRGAALHALRHKANRSQHRRTEHMRTYLSFSMTRACLLVDTQTVEITA